MRKWAFDHFGLDKEYIWVQVAMDERELYISYGWEDVDFGVIDLSEWREKVEVMVGIDLRQ
jgi:hypothetical protein